MKKLSNLFSLRSLRRRDFLRISSLTLLASAVGCHSEYQRAAWEYDLGDVSDLLYSKQFLREIAMFVARDDLGWRAMSTRCTYDGCELSYEDEILSCVCCGSVFGHQGQVFRGPAYRGLPHYQITYRDRHLFTDTAQQVSPDLRYTTPQIEQALVQLRQRIAKEGARTGKKVPDILLGKNSDSPDGMFKERKDSVVPDLLTSSPTPSPAEEGRSSVFEKIRNELLKGARPEESPPGQPQPGPTQ